MKIAFIQQEAYEKVSVHFLSGALKFAGHECDVFIEELEQDFIGSVAQYAPDYIAVSLYIGEETASFDALQRLHRRLPDTKTLVGGPYCLIFPDTYLRPEVDYLFRGDAEMVLPEFLRRMAEGGEIHSLPGISYLDENGVARVNDDLELSDVGNLPAPDRDLYYRYPELRSKPTKIFIGARGCPYRCTYCYNTELRKFYSSPYWRTRPVQDVIDEIRYVQQHHGLSWVHFVCGTFNASKKWLNEFLDAYISAKLPPFLCNCRVENIDEDLIQKMKNAGCDRITFGIQSGNQRIRKDIAGRAMTDDQIREACRLCKQYSIRVGVDIIFGWPSETVEEAMDTIRLCREIDIDSYSSNVLRFYPGLEVRRYAVNVIV